MSSSEVATITFKVSGAFFLMMAVLSIPLLTAQIQAILHGDGAYARALMLAVGYLLPWAVGIALCFARVVPTVSTTDQAR